MGRLSKWWRSLPFPWRPWRIVDEVGAADEIPDRLPHRGAALVASGGFRTWLAFDCPCGMGHRVMLNLDASRYPRWVISRSEPLTVWPSVDDRMNTRRCHFMLQRGRVTWVQDDEPIGAM